jgi:glycosyltransferase involved in cell wall biosynthesis
MIKSSNSKTLRVWLPVIRAGSGADVFTVRLFEGLRKAGHEPLLQWFDHRYEFMPWKLKSVRAPANIDLVHAGSWQGFAFKRPGVPLVVTEHQYISHPDFLPYRSLSQALYHRFFCNRWATRSYSAADAVVTVSNYCAGAMRAEIAEPVTVIHNWVDTEQFAPARVPKLDAGDNVCMTPFKLLFVGNPSRWKGADLLPSIARLLGSSFQLQCIGGLRTGFSAARLPPNLTVLGRRAPDQMPDLYRSVDAVLIPTRYESFGFVALEAMACGIPVLGFHHAGTSELCVNGKTGLLAPLEDINQLADCARQLASDQVLSKKLGSAGRRRAIELFGESRAISGYVDVYRRAIGSEPPAPS